MAGASLVVRWRRICLAMQETPIPSLVREHPTRWGTTKPVHGSYWSLHTRARALQRATPLRWEPSTAIRGQSPLPAIRQSLRTATNTRRRQKWIHKKYSYYFFKWEENNFNWEAVWYHEKNMSFRKHRSSLYHPCDWRQYLNFLVSKILDLNPPPLFLSNLGGLDYIQGCIHILKDLKLLTASRPDKNQNYF